MARSKSTARSAAAKTAAKTRKRRAAGKKALATRKRRAAAKKAVTTRKRRGAAKKAAATRKRAKPAVKASASKAVAPRTTAARAVAPQGVAEIDQRIAIIRGNLRELTEQAAGLSGGSTEELMAERIAAQEALLEALSKRRESLLRGS